MGEYRVEEVSLRDVNRVKRVVSLLEQEHISLDKNVDYIAAIFSEEGEAVATGSAFGNTLRSFAVRSSHQGEGLLNTIVSHLIEMQVERGNLHLFLYAKMDSAHFFASLGFHEICRVDGTLVFMENKRNGFASYLEKLKRTTVEASGRVGAVVMNANPFTKGHRYLVEKALEQCEILHLFVVSEDKSLVPFPVRWRLVEEGTKDFPQVILHPSGPYIISNATFPSYFLKDEESVMKAHARLDALLFTHIATSLGIQLRVVGTEPKSHVTALYNEVLKEELPKEGVELIEIPRLELNGEAISASEVRVRIKEGKAWQELLPESSVVFLSSAEAGSVLDRIRKASEVVHH